MKTTSFTAPAASPQFEDTLAIWIIRIAVLVLVVAIALPVPAMVGFANPAEGIVFGRYTLKYFTLMVGYIGTTAILAGLGACFAWCLDEERLDRIRGVIARHLGLALATLTLAIISIAAFRAMILTPLVLFPRAVYEALAAVPPYLFLATMTFSIPFIDHRISEAADQQLEQLGSVAIIVMLLVLAVIISMPDSPALWDQGRDNGVYTYVGMAISKGQVAYRDAWTHKPPAIDYVYGLAFNLLGVNRWSVWVAETAVLFLASVLVYRLVSSVWQRPLLSWVSVLLFLITARSPEFTGIGGNITTEGIGLLPQAVVFAAGLQFLRKPSVKWCVVIGLASSAAFLAKQTNIGVSLAFIPALLLTLHPSARSPKCWLWLGTMVATGLAGLGITALFFITQGAFADAYDALFPYTRVWFDWVEGAGLPIWEAIYRSLTQSAITTYLRPPVLVPGLVATSYLVLRHPGDDGSAARTRRTFTAWAMLAFLADLVLANLSGQTLNHYYIALAISLTLVIITGLNALAEQGVMSRVARWLWLWVGLTFAAGGLVKMLTGVSEYGLIVPFIAVLGTACYALLVGRESYRKSPFPAVTAAALLVSALYVWRLIDISPPATLFTWLGPARRFPAADYIAEHTAPGETVFIWGAESALYVQANRLSPTPFHYSYPLLLPSYTTSRVERVLNSLQAHRTRLIIDATYNANRRTPPLDPDRREEWLALGGRGDTGDLTPLYDFIATHCTVVDTLDFDSPYWHDITLFVYECDY